MQNTNREFNTFLESITIGDFTTNIMNYPPGLVWDRWNNRELSHSHAKKLAWNMHLNGADNVAEDTKVFYGLRPEWIANLDEANPSKHLTTNLGPLHPLVLSKAGQIAAQRGLAFSFAGRHRQRALQLVRSVCDDSIEVAKQSIDYIEENIGQY